MLVRPGGMWLITETVMAPVPCPTVIPRAAGRGRAKLKSKTTSVWGQERFLPSAWLGVGGSVSHAW